METGAWRFDTDCSLDHKENWQNVLETCHHTQNYKCPLGAIHAGRIHEQDACCKKTG